MRIFLAEYLTSGASPDGGALSPLAIEGAAMLRALAADAARVPGWQVAVVWDSKLGSFGISGVEVYLSHSADQERLLFEKLAEDADRSLIIAPECGGLLEWCCRSVESCEGRFAGPTPDAVALCGDKLALSRHLQEMRISTIETQSCEFDRLTKFLRTAPDGVIIKPRCGAGCIDTFHVTTSAELSAVCTVFRSDSADEPIVQPYLAGESLSVAGIVSPHGIELFPVCRQRIERRGNRLHYAGGSVPAATERDTAVADLACKAIAAIPGLLGYVGVDLLLPADSTAEPIVVEINPRLTSSYHGYRLLADDNLAPSILAPEIRREPMNWQADRFEFHPDGTTNRIP